MRKTKLVTFFMLIMLLALSTGLMAGTYSGGNGSSAETAYQIATKADLLELSNTSGDWVSGIYFKQTADIIFSTADFQDGGDYYNGGAGFPPISGPFKGTYDGQNYMISNLYINTSQASELGLFRYLSDGTIQNLTISNMTLICTAGSSSWDGVGMLVGDCRGTINNVHISGGSIQNLNAVAGYGGTGTLVGNMIDATISYCTSSASVSGSQIGTGGLIGYSGGGTTNNVSYCSATGNVTSTGGRVGGLFGYMGNIGTIQFNSCYATGDVSADASGGFVGLVFSNSTYNDCYATGDVTGSWKVGGFYGFGLTNNMNVDFNRCYSSGSVPSGMGGFGYDTDGITFNIIRDSVPFPALNLC